MLLEILSLTKTASRCHPRVLRKQGKCFWGWPQVNLQAETGGGRTREWIAEWGVELIFLDGQ